MKAGFITIGQSPRSDVMKDISPILERFKIDYIECGALDDLSREQIKLLQPESEKDYVLVTRLRDGSEVKLSRSNIVSLMQDCISKLEDTVDVIGILCTGDFPELKSKKLLMEPSLLLKKVVEAISPTTMTVLIPAPEQEEEVREKWNLDEDMEVIPISPYTSGEKDFRDRLKNVEAGQLVVLDCIGYSKEMKKLTESILKKPVILPRTLLASLIGEIS